MRGKLKAFCCRTSQSLQYAKVHWKSMCMCVCGYCERVCVHRTEFCEQPSGVRQRTNKKNTYVSAYTHVYTDTRARGKFHRKNVLVEI